MTNNNSTALRRNNPILVGIRKLEKIRIKSKYLPLSSSVKGNDNKNDGFDNNNPTKDKSSTPDDIEICCSDDKTTTTISSHGSHNDLKNSKNCTSRSNSVVVSRSNSSITATSLESNHSDKLIDSSNNNDTDADNNATDDSVALIVGIEDVILGVKPASESIKILGMQPWRYIWYMISGGLCDVVQLFIDYMIHVVLFNIQDASVCWALGFILSIVVRHTSHRYLVSGDYVGGYWNSLCRMYMGYSIIITLSTLFNLILSRVFFLEHYVAWVFTFLWTGIANYFILKKVWSFDGSTGMNISSTLQSTTSCCSERIKILKQCCCSIWNRRDANDSVILMNQGYFAEDNQGCHGEHLYKEIECEKVKQEVQKNKELDT